MEEQKDIFDYIEKRKVDMPDKAYFENLSKNVIASQTKQEAKVIPLFKRPIVWMSAVAAAVLVLLLLDFDAGEDIITPEPNALAELDNVSRAEILAYVDENIEEFDVELLAEFVPANQLNSDYSELNQETIPKDEAPIESVSFDNITKEDILEYLEEEDLDLSDLDDEDSFI